MIPKIAIFISGTGSNMAAALEQNWALRVCAVVSSKSVAPGVGRAQRRGVPTYILPKTLVVADWRQLHDWLVAHKINGLFLAGFMKVLPEFFVELWAQRILNIHPSLLPQYPGLHSIERAHKDGNQVGVTLHDVTAEVDAGQIFSQSCVSRDPKAWELADLERVVHAREHHLVRRDLNRWVNSLM